MRFTIRRLSLAPAALAVAALVGGALPAGYAAATPEHGTGHVAGHHTAPGTLTREARADGLTAAGGGRMGWREPSATASGGSTAPATSGRATTTMTKGLDVSAYQGDDVSWPAQYARDRHFAYVKATEGSSYTNPYFDDQYDGAADAGLLHGAYHFANPGGAAGGVQASYFIAHGGKWVGDGNTLPGVLDIEYNPYDDGTGVCYGLSASQMRTWISTFLTRYKNVTGRPAVIYTTTDWWTRCTGNTSAFSKTNVLWIARYASSPGTLSAGWGSWAFWQYAAGTTGSDGTSTPDLDYFFAGLPRLHKFAAG